MALWLRQISQGHEKYYHDVEVMGSKPGRFNFVVSGSSV